MKIALIIPSVHWNCPYADIYAKLFASQGVDYDIISFNRKLDKEDTKYHFDYSLHNSSSKFTKLKANIRYCKYIKRILNEENYDRLVVFSSQIGLGLLSTLLTKYKGKYIFDYRDVSIEQKLMLPFKMLLKSSYMNVISSPGFLRVLPQGYEYEKCHNLNIQVAENAVKEQMSGGWDNGGIHILTIGGIRDYYSNIQVIDAVKGRKDISLSFVGKGESSELLSNYCNSNGIDNVSFVGYYKKEEEPAYIKKANFINIFYPRKVSHDTAVSNRFYNSLIYKKPMITTAHTTQGDYAAKYQIGVALDDCTNLIDSLKNFIKDNDYNDYCTRCNNLLQQFIEEQRLFEKKVLSFIDKNNP